MKPERDENGNLPAFAWPGGYPIFYLCADGGILCPQCANKESAVKEADEHADYPDLGQWRIVARDVTLVDATLTYDNFGHRIKSPYPDQQAGPPVHPTSAALPAI